MRQKLCRSESAREQRIELYVQATIISTISNHRYSRNGGYRGDTEHESSPTTPTMSSHQIDSRGGRSSSTTYTTVTTATTTTTNNNNTRSNNRACSEVEAGGLRARPTPLPSLPRDFFSPVVSIHPVWEHRTTVTYSCSVIAVSVRVHASGPRHKYCQCNTQWTNNKTTPRAADRLSGSSTCTQSQQPKLVDQSETRQVSDLGPPPLDWVDR